MLPSGGGLGTLVFPPADGLDFKIGRAGASPVFKNICAMSNSKKAIMSVPTVSRHSLRASSSLPCPAARSPR